MAVEIPAAAGRAPMAGLLAACAAGVLWGTGAVVVHLLVEQHGFTPASISFWRFAIGALVLLLVFGWRIDWTRALALGLPLMLAGTAMAGYVLCWFLGIERIGPAVPTLIALCLPPVLVTGVAVLRGRERLDRPLLAVLAAAIGGTALVVVPHGGPGQGISVDHLAAGVAFSVASAVLYAGFAMVSGRISHALGAGPATTCLTLVAATMMAGFSLWRPLQWPDTVPPQAWTLYLGVVTAALALLAFSWGAARLSPTALTVATLVEPLTAVTLSALVLGESMSIPQWAGGLLLMTSLWVLGRRATSGTASASDGHTGVPADGGFASRIKAPGRD
jgi:DME family drug/metabolite transporter